MPAKPAEAHWKKLPPRELMAFFKKLQREHNKTFESLHRTISDTIGAAETLYHNIQIHQIALTPASSQLLLEKRQSVLKELERQKQIFLELHAVAAHIIEAHPGWLDEKARIEIGLLVQSYKTSAGSMDMSISVAKQKTLQATDLKRTAIKLARESREKLPGKLGPRDNVIDAKERFRRRPK